MTRDSDTSALMQLVTETGTVVMPRQSDAVGDECPLAPSLRPQIGRIQARVKQRSGERGNLLGPQFAVRIEAGQCGAFSIAEAVQVTFEPGGLSNDVRQAPDEVAHFGRGRLVTILGLLGHAASWDSPCRFVFSCR